MNYHDIKTIRDTAKAAGGREWILTYNCGGMSVEVESAAGLVAIEDLRRIPQEIPEDQQTRLAQQVQSNFSHMAACNPQTAIILIDLLWKTQSALRTAVECLKGSTRTCVCPYEDSRMTCNGCQDALAIRRGEAILEGAH